MKRKVKEKIQYGRKKKRLSSTKVIQCDLDDVTNENSFKFSSDESIRNNNEQKRGRRIMKTISPKNTNQELLNDCFNDNLDGKISITILEKIHDESVKQTKLLEELLEKLNRKDNDEN